MAHMMTALHVSVVGLTVVFGALLLIAGMLSLLNRLPEAKTPQSKTGDAGDDIPEEIIVVLAAAAEAALGARVRIRRVRYSRPQSEQMWSEQGRITIMASHITRS
ncbi:MAG: OadG family protein [Acidobacteriota bacterium]|nr:OadG family protein [Acidobacteriota bacterium]